jgi:AcrR family transcriptional regulator
VERALIDAAATLFGARGPDAVSVRDLAAEAGVNHGLVHRYFGSKEGLLGAVLDRLAADVAAQVGSTDPERGDAGAVIDRYWRVLARAILDGKEVAALQRDFPTVSLLKQAVADEHGCGEREAARRAAQILALELGWRMFEPFLLRAAELQDADPAELARTLADGTRRLAVGS